MGCSSFQCTWHHCHLSIRFHDGGSGWTLRLVIKLGYPSMSELVRSFQCGIVTHSDCLRYAPRFNIISVVAEGHHPILLSSYSTSRQAKNSPRAISKKSEAYSAPTYAYDEATFEKQKMGIHIKHGIRLNLSPKIWFEGYYGVGVAHRKKQYTDITGLRVHDNRYNRPHAPCESDTYVLQLPCGFKIGVVLFDGQDR